MLNILADAMRIAAGNYTPANSLRPLRNQRGFLARVFMAPGPQVRP